MNKSRESCAALIIAGIAVVRSQSIRHNLIKFGAARKESADLMNSLPIADNGHV